MTEQPSPRRLPRPSPFVLMLTVIAVVVALLLGLLALKPKADTSPLETQAPARTTSEQATHDVKTWAESDARRRKANGP